MNPSASRKDRILVIDDDPSMLTVVKGVVPEKTCEVVNALTLSHGIQLANQNRFEVIVLDHRLPDGEGFDAIETLIAHDRLRPILYITAQAGASTAIEAIKRGAFEYISKPIDFSLLRDRLREAVDYRKLTRIPVLVDGTTRKDEFSSDDIIVGRCRAMQEVYKGMGRLAMLDCPILVDGETGTGKEMIARTIHAHSKHATKDFRKINLIDLSETEIAAEIESNLDFKEGSNEFGTLFLEEISHLSFAIQSKLIRFLKETDANKKLPFRLIFSTSKNANRMVEQGHLRSDFFYYIAPYRISVPSLRDRRDDIDLLVAHFVHLSTRLSSTDQHQGPARVSAEALELLRNFDWPGNVAQLKSLLQTALLESRGAILATETLQHALHRDHHVEQEQFDRSSVTHSQDHSQSAVRISLEHQQRSAGAKRENWDLRSFVNQNLNSDTDELYSIAVNAMDKQLLTIVLTHTNGNQARAAKLLGMTRTSLRRKMAATNLRLQDFVTLENSLNAHDSIKSQIGSE